MADSDKVAIVTGAARGIGREICRELLAMGMTVVAVDLLAEKFPEMQADLGSPGEKLDCRKLDVTDSEGFTALVDAVAEKYGHVDVLVNNAGITKGTTLDKFDEALFDQVLDTNLKSAFLMSRAAVPDMLTRGAGSVVNIASVHAIATYTPLAVYSASKAGLCGLTRGLAVEFAARGIRFNAVLPGNTDTSLHPRSNQAVDPATWQPRPLDGLPIKRAGTPAEIAAAIAFLASDEASYITGAALVVDGGMLSILRDR